MAIRLSGATSEREDRAHAVLPAELVVGGAIVLVGMANGGYSSITWGIGLIVAGAILCAAPLVFREMRVSVSGLCAVALLAAYVGWVAVSAQFRRGEGAPTDEVVRVAFYAAALLLFLVWARSGRQLLVGALTGSLGLCSYALLVYLFTPGGRTIDPTGQGYLLYRPIGYPNAAGAVAAIGLVVAVGLTATRDDRSHSQLAIAGAAAAPFGAVLALTASRAAAVGALIGAMLLVAFGDAEHRARTAKVCVLALLGGLAAAATLDPSGASGPASGARAATLGLSLAVLAAAGTFERPRATNERAKLGVLVGTVIAVAVLFSVGGAQFTGAGVLDTGTRTDYWQTAWSAGLRNPIAGGGEGAFRVAWAVSDPGKGAQNAHSLPLETFAEEGAVGLALLVAALGAPFLWRRPGAVLSTGVVSYALFIWLCLVDWHWELAVVPLCGLSCAAALAHRAGRAAAVVSGRLVWAGGVLAVIAGSLGVFGDLHG